MVKRIIVGLAFGLTLAVSTSAQTSVSGQIFLPNGNLPSQPIRFYFTSDNGMVNDYRYTDSNGRFTLESLLNTISYTLTVSGDGSTYGDTVYHLPPLSGRFTRVSVTLSPPPRKPNAPGYTTSVASAYKPVPQATALYERAMKEVEKRRYDAAEPLLRKAIQSDPKFVAPYNDLGVLLMQQRKYLEAEKILRQAIEVDPKSLHSLLNLGITLNHLGKYADAVPRLREALRVEPGLVAAHLHLGIALVETDQFEEAERELTHASKARTEEEILMQQLYLGKLYARTGDFEKAIIAFDTYLQKAPNASNANEVRALIERMKREVAARH